MRGLTSFVPVDPALFDGLIRPLLAGSKVNPEAYLDSALQLGRVAARCRPWVAALELQLESAKPPPPPEEGKLWDKVRARLERFDFRPDALSVAAALSVEPELHLEGRPFVIAEGSAERVAEVVEEYRTAESPAAVDALAREQLLRLDKRLAALEVGEADAPPDSVQRRSLLAALKELHDLARMPEPAAAGWGAALRPRRGPAEPLGEELAWKAARCASRAAPYWIARDVDGLETICRAAAVEPPACLTPAWRLFGDACEEFPGLREALGVEVRSARSVGGFVEPAAVPELLEFLNRDGTRIIQAATRAGEGPACTTLLRKIRECARYAERRGAGYLEVSGLGAPGTLED